MPGFPWAESYPSGVSVSPPLEIGRVDELLSAAAKRFPDHSALSFSGRRIAYAELDRLVSAAAKGFQALGVKPGDKVGLYLPNAPQFPIAFFGALRAGAVIVTYSPLDAARVLEAKIADSETDILVTLDLAALYPQIAAILGRSRLRHLVVGDLAEFCADPLAMREQLAESGQLAKVAPDPRLVRFSTLIDNDGRHAPAPAADPFTSLAALLYTGGTTGEPKGAMLTHANITAAVSQYRVFLSGDQPAMGEGCERFLVALPLYHIYALVVLLLLGTRLGAELTLHVRFDAERVARDIEDKRITVFPGVPTMFVALLHHPAVKPESLRSLRYCACGGAPLPLKVQLAFEALSGCRVGEGWGMTETCSMGAVAPIRGRAHEGSCGVPGPGVDVRFLSLEDSRRYLAYGQRGEICIKGPNVAIGYWNNEKATQAAFTPEGYFRTGDVGQLDADGFLYIVDRTKDMILCGGFNVYPRNIEEAIYQHPAVEAVSVIGVPDDYRGQSPKAFVKLKAGAPAPTLEEMKAFLKDRLGRHEMISALEIRPDLPRTLVGKLSKKELYDEEALKRRA